MKHTLIQQEPTPFSLSQCTSTIVPTLRRSRVFEAVSFTGRCADDPEIERGISRAAEDQPAKQKLSPAEPTCDREIIEVG
uniref:Uncharacterized protein n=1 Tax=Picea glauca TaxID=3330 RepID=A0A117NI74_PICGL|nr:hypothetical protein ABT39_MTgene2727 [Picea glauca]